MLLCYYFVVKKQKVMRKTQNVFGLIYSFTHFHVAYAGGVSAMRKSPMLEAMVVNEKFVQWKRNENARPRGGA